MRVDIEGVVSISNWGKFHSAVWGVHALLTREANGRVVRCNWLNVGRVHAEATLFQDLIRGNLPQAGLLVNDACETVVIQLHVLVDCGRPTWEPCVTMLIVLTVPLPAVSSYVKAASGPGSDLPSISACARERGAWECWPR
jgi:hypothetical protein